MATRKEVWEQMNLSKSIFKNTTINIDSTDVRNSNNLKELKAIAEYLHSHINDLLKIKELIIDDDKLSKHRKYIFVQTCLKSQVDWQIFKAKQKNKKEQLINN